jgi:uncharacterized Fe-S cluster-containing radical SAM superfamily protein
MKIPERFITLHLTRRCNSRCRFCVTDPIGAREEVSLDDAEAFLRDNAGQGYEAFSLVGGEPTIYRHLPELLDLARHYGYPLSQLFTNGRRLADRAYAESLVARGARFFVVSLHGPDAQAHDALTDVPGSFAEAVAGIRNLKELGQVVQTLSVVTATNYRVLRPTVELLMNLGVDVIDLAGLCPHGLAEVNWNEVQVAYGEMMPFVREAMQTVLAAGREAVLEGFPFCVVRPYEHRCWEYPGSRHERLLYQRRLIADYDACINTSKVHAEACTSCAVRKVCGGIYVGYAATYGSGELSPLSAYEPQKAALGRGLPAADPQPIAAAVN